MINIIEQNDLDSFVTIVIKEPTTNERRKNYNNNKAKEKRIIYDSVKDNIMSVVTPLKKSKECFDTLMNLYEKKAPTQKRDLENKLRNMNMERDDTIASFLENISQVKDHIIRINVETYDDDFLQTSIDRIPVGISALML